MEKKIGGFNPDDMWNIEAKKKAGVKPEHIKALEAIQSHIHLQVSAIAEPFLDGVLENKGMDHETKLKEVKGLFCYLMYLGFNVCVQVYGGGNGEFENKEMAKS